LAGWAFVLVHATIMAEPYLIELALSISALTGRSGVKPQTDDDVVRDNGSDIR
jgi:hypothetical protein